MASWGVRLGVAVAVLAAAVAGSAVLAQGRDGDAVVPTRHGLPGCVGAIERKPLPPGWNVPLPPGTVPTQLVTGAIQQVVGFAPGKFDGVVSFFRRDLVRRGYRSTSFDAEYGESEALFSGHGIDGQWRVNTVPGCDGANVVSVAVI